MCSIGNATEKKQGGPNEQKTKNENGSGGIRTHASHETGALNQRLRPLGHATTLADVMLKYIFKY